MSFSESGGTITQTGTDDTASFITGMQGITGVTVNQYGNTGHSTFTIIDFANLSLNVQGTLVVNMKRQNWIFTGSDMTDRIKNSASGVLTLECDESRSGFDYNPEGGSIMFALDNSTSWNSKTIHTDSGGQALFNGITFRGEHSPWFNRNATLRNCIIEKIGNDGDIQTNIANSSVTFDGVKIYADGQSGITFRGGTPTINNVEVYGARDAFNNESTSYITIVGLVPDTGTDADISQWGGRNTRVLNAQKGTEFIVGGHVGDSTNNTGKAAVFQSLLLTAIDAEGIAIEGRKFYIEDNPLVGSSDHTIIDDGILANVQRVYEKTTDVNGEVASFDVLIGNCNRTSGGLQISTNPDDNWLRPRGKNVDGTTTSTNTVTDDLYDWASISYNEVITSGEVELKGVSGTAVLSISSTDLSLTETNKAIVDAYTSLDDPFKFYDKAKSYLVDNYAGEASTTVSRSGDLIDAGSYDVDIDATAGSAYGLVGNKITIKSSEFTGDLTTTGIITLLNGAKVVGSVTDINGTVTSVPYSITNLIAGSRVKIRNESTATNIYNEIVAGTSLVGTYTEGVEYTSGDTIVLRVVNVNGLTAYCGYQSTVLAGSTGFSFLADQVLNTVYNGNGVNGSLITGIVLDQGNVEFDIDEPDNNKTAQEIYAWYENEQMTATGIETLFSAIMPDSEYRYAVHQEIIDLQFDNKDLVNALTITGGYFYRLNGTAVTASGSGTIEMVPKESYIANSDSIGADLTSVKAKTDQLAFTAGSVDSNVLQVDSDVTAAANLKNQYDGTTGLTGALFPSTQLQVGSLAVGAGGISTIANTATVTTGTVTSGDVIETQQLDGVVHSVEDVGNNTDFYYEFNVGITGVATEIIWDGYVQSRNDTVDVFGWDWVSVSWKQVGTIVGENGIVDQEHAYIFTSNMTGRGADSGKVRFRFNSTTVTQVSTDRILCEYTSLPEIGNILHTGVAQAGTTNTITLDVAANATDEFYNHARVVISSGLGSEQERIIVVYNGTTKVATIAPPWITVPDATSAFEVIPATVHAETNSKTVKVGLAQGATTSTITLAPDASSVDEFYDDDVIEIDAGTGQGQSRIIVAYNGTTKVATVTPDWLTTPDTTSEYLIEASLVAVGKIETDVIDANSLATTAVQEIVDGTWDEPLTGAIHNDSTSAGRRLRQANQIVAAESTVNGGTPTTTSFLTNLVHTDNDAYNDQTLTFTSGVLSGQAKTITDYDGTTKRVTFDEGFTQSPSSSDEFVIFADHVHPISQIQDGLDTLTNIKPSISI